MAYIHMVRLADIYVSNSSSVDRWLSCTSLNNNELKSLEYLLCARHYSKAFLCITYASFSSNLWGRYLGSYNFTIIR